MSFAHSDITWTESKNKKEYKLNLRNKETGYFIIQDARYSSQWRLCWPNGELSQDFYNLTRAKDNLAKIVLNLENQDKAILASN